MDVLIAISLFVRGLTFDARGELVLPPWSPSREYPLEHGGLLIRTGDNRRGVEPAANAQGRLARYGTSGHKYRPASGPHSAAEEEGGGG